MVYYLDASAWGKRYVQESGSDVVTGLFESPIATSPLGLIEIISTLARKNKAGQLAAQVLQERINTIEADWGYFIQVPVTQDVLGFAKSAAQNLALRGADAVHLGTALYLRQQLIERGEEVILVTSDQELKAAAHLSEIFVLDPTQDNSSQPES